MEWVLVGWAEITRWVDAEPDGRIRVEVLRWLDRFHDGYGFAEGVPVPGYHDLYVARVPATRVSVTFFVKHGLNPPCIAIRQIEPPGP